MEELVHDRYRSVSEVPPIGSVRCPCLPLDGATVIGFRLHITK